MRGAGGCAGQRAAGRGDAAAAHHRDGDGLRPGAVTGDAGELLGAGGEGRARGAAPDAGPAQQEQVAVGTGAGAAAGAGAGGACADDPEDEIGPGLAIDETADLRKGKSTACVSPQHAGVTGKVENCVTWVFTALVTAFGQAWVDFDVYMPDCWAKDPRAQEEGRDPGGPGVRHQAGTGHRAGQAPDRGRAAGAVGRRRRSLRPVRRVPGRAPGARPVLRRHHPLRLPRSRSRRTRSPALTRRFTRPCSRGGPAGTARKGPRYADWALLATKDPRRAPADPPPAGPGEEPVHVLPVPRGGRPPRDPDLFHHHRRPQVASRNYFQNGEGRVRLGPVPGPHLGRPLPAHRPDRPRPGQGHRHPVRPVRRRRPPARPRRPSRTAAATRNEPP